MSDQPFAEAATYTTHNKRKRRIFMHSARFETAVAELRFSPHGHCLRQYKWCYS